MTVTSHLLFAAVYPLLFVFVNRINGDKAADLIRNLPGLTFDPGFKQYSGFLGTKAGSYLHYWFVESQNDPLEDPLVLWLNGGPGCSSVGGFLTELGPFRVNSDGVTLFENIYSWNKVANVLFLESPRDVGYSYRDPSLPPDHVYNDTKTAIDNADAILTFINRFPEYQQREFFITGESYAGFYIPTLADLLVKRIHAGEMPGLNLQGFAIGNGILNEVDNDNSLVDLTFYRGTIGLRAFEALQQCCNSSCRIPLASCNFSQSSSHSSYGSDCSDIVNYILEKAFIDGSDPYNNYQDCYMAKTQKAMKHSNSRFLKMMPALNLSGTFVDQGSKINIGSTDAQNGFPCWMSWATANYMNLPNVRSAQHIPARLSVWSDCNDNLNDEYVRLFSDMAPFFESMFNSSYPLRILIYNGDVDSVCNFLGDQWFTQRLADNNGFKGSTREPLQFEDCTAGFQKRFTKGNVNLDFVTIKGAGHFVPLDRGGPALQMIANFLHNDSYNYPIIVDTQPKPLLPQYQPSQPQSYSRKEADRIWSLPDVTFDTNFQQYSGYLKGDAGNYLHYWFVESQNEPETVPLVLWLGGGPGCSSLVGLLLESGPFWLDPHKSTLAENVFSWNKVANILFLDAPRNVGFSFQNMTENTEKHYNDKLTAQDSFLAVMDFLSVYPEYKNRPFYIAGESYAGVYVLTLASLIIDKIQANNAHGLNLAGTSIGNGYLSAKHLYNSLPLLLYNRGIFGDGLIEFMERCCPNKSQPLRECDLSRYVTIDEYGLPEPIDLSDCAQKTPFIDSSFDWITIKNEHAYNMYQDCYSNKRADPYKQKFVDKKSKTGSKFFNQLSKMNFASTDSQGGYMCYSVEEMEKYLNRDASRRALHTSPYVRKYLTCSDEINYDYRRQLDVAPVIKHIVNSGYKLHVLMYNGDLDLACNFIGVEQFVEALATELPMQQIGFTTSWKYEHVTAGYFTRYLYQSSLLLDYLTVMGAGKMVSTDRPGPALQMFANFINYSDYSFPLLFSTDRKPLKPEYQVQVQVTAEGKDEIKRPVGSHIKPKQKRSKEQLDARTVDPPSGSKEMDRIVALPGLTFSASFAQYSGYLNATSGNFLHYWLVESQNNQSEAPLLIWFNGGPGCSSLIGLFHEHGPYRQNPDGETLFENQFSWNKFANVVYMESPPGVGFSYRSNATSTQQPRNDTTTAVDNLLAIASFYDRFPEYKNRDLYLAGEGYAAIYILTLAELLIQHISTDMSYVNLKGLTIGNGAISLLDQVRTAPELLYYRGVIGTSAIDQLKPCCTQKGVYDNHCDLAQYIEIDNDGSVFPKSFSDPIAEKCAETVYDLGYNRVWSDLDNAYNTYQACYDKTDSRRSRPKRSVPGSSSISMTNKIPFIDEASRINTRSTDPFWSLPCYELSATLEYLNRADVRSSIHIPDGVPSWTKCSADIQFDYRQQYNDTTALFKSIIDSNYTLKVLIYNGDMDMANNFLGADWFIQRLSKSYGAYRFARHQWHYAVTPELQKFTAGHYKHFSFRNKLLLSLLTVKGAGSMVGADRPGPALQMISNFIFGRSYSRIAPYNLTLHPLLPAYIPDEPKVPRKEADKVYKLPGLTYNINFSHYSGYLKSAPGSFLHYWFVESQGNPATDPVMLWLNGGPGCSSLIGLFGELGPFRPNPDGETLFENVFSWNKVANILFLESPREVGFSYQQGGDAVLNDTQTALENANALEDFFTIFPKYLNNDFYAAGESYAGVYIPTLVSVLIDRIKNGTSQIKLRGLAIGNGALSVLNQIRSTPDFLYFHDIYGYEEWNNIIRCCPNYGKEGSKPPVICDYDKYVNVDSYGNINERNFTNPFDTLCSHLVAELSNYQLAAVGIDAFNLYQDCYHQSNSHSMSAVDKRKHLNGLRKIFVDELSRAPRNYQSAHSKISMAYVNTVSTDSTGGFQCYAHAAIQKYLNQIGLRNAIHIPEYVQTWQSCRAQIASNYWQLYNDTKPIFQNIIDSGYAMRMLMYVGDVDSTGNILETEYTLEQLAEANHMERSARASWYYQLAPGSQRRIGGFVTTLRKGSVEIDSITVKGSGKWAATDRAGPTLQVITNFLRHSQRYSERAPFSTQRQPLLPQYQRPTAKPPTPRYSTTESSLSSTTALPTTPGEMTTPTERVTTPTKTVTAATEGMTTATRGITTTTEGMTTATEGMTTATEGMTTATEGMTTATEGMTTATEGMTTTTEGMTTTTETVTAATKRMTVTTKATTAAPSQTSATTSDPISPSTSEMIMTQDVPKSLPRITPTSTSQHTKQSTSTTTNEATRTMLSSALNVILVLLASYVLR